MATAYGVAPLIAWKLDDISTPHEYLMVKNAEGKLVPKLDNRKMPIVNPNYESEVYEFGRALAPRFDELKGRQAFARRAAHGFNITLELLRRARNINFVNEVCVDWVGKTGGGGGGGSLTDSMLSYHSSVKEASSAVWACSTATASENTSSITATSWQSRRSRRSRNRRSRSKLSPRVARWWSWNVSNAIRSPKLRSSRRTFHRGANNNNKDSSSVTVSNVVWRFSKGQSTDGDVISPQKTSRNIRRETSAALPAATTGRTRASNRGEDSPAAEAKAPTSRTTASGTTTKPVRRRREPRRSTEAASRTRTSLATAKAAAGINSFRCECRSVLPQNVRSVSPRRPATSLSSLLASRHGRSVRN